MIRLVWRNLLKHPLRALLTVGSLCIAMFLLCTLRSVVTTLNAGVNSAQQNRLWVISSVSLFVQLPLNYQEKIRKAPGVVETCKWQWFGGYYQSERNFFGQFACDKPELLKMWPEIEIIDGSAENFVSKRIGCLVGEGLAKDYGFKVGDTVPLIGALFPGPNGAAWEFTVEGIYRPSKPTLDNRTMFFGWEYFAETFKSINGEESDVGVVVIESEKGRDITEVIAAVDGMFEGGPQRVRTTTEAEFQRQFVTMIGNVPRLLSFIGGGVFIAILLACINTMLMTGREQTHDIGILKALGFKDATLFRMMILQSMILCGLGGALGIGLAELSAPVIGQVMQMFFPGYKILPETATLAAVITVLIGLFSGLVPAWNASRLRCVEALRSQA